ncbi:unnamed protein product [Polarella glacialis]|uniref:Uncharacterized protein n=1 Tax=Polarella glacialis TaxID=89957 RepID=A0A813IMF9_POLGL|nr:unnamed protein product [Polarella glacialis]
MALNPDDECLIAFNVGGPVLYHKRIIGGHIENTEYMVISPDLDVYGEDLVVGVDVASVRFLAPGGGLPVGILAADVYDFDPLTPAERQRLLRDAAVLTQQERGRRGLPVAGGAAPGGGGVGPPGFPPPAPPGLPPGGIVAQALAARVGVNAAPGPPGHAAGAGAGVAGGGLIGAALGALPAPRVWIFSESRGHVVLGDEVNITGYTHQVLGDRGVIEYRGTHVSIRSIIKATVNPDHKGIADNQVDERVCPLHLDSGGRRNYDFRDQVISMTPPRYTDWPIIGPTTVVWLLTYMYKNGGCPNTFHQRWMTDVRLDYSTNGTSEHLLLCRVFEILLSYDGVNLSRCAGAELISRKIQMIHERWKHKLPNFNPINNSNNNSKNQTIMMRTIPICCWGPVRRVAMLVFVLTCRFGWAPNSPRRRWHPKKGAKLVKSVALVEVSLRRRSEEVRGPPRARWISLFGAQPLWWLPVLFSQHDSSA